MSKNCIKKHKKYIDMLTSRHQSPEFIGSFVNGEIVSELIILIEGWISWIH
jgi:hypothetical protein